MLLVVAMRWKRKIRPWLGLDEQELQRNAFNEGFRGSAMVTSDDALGNDLKRINKAEASGRSFRQEFKAEVSG